MQISPGNKTYVQKENMFWFEAKTFSCFRTAKRNLDSISAVLSGSVTFSSERNAGSDPFPNKRCLLNNVSWCRHAHNLEGVM